MKRDNSKWARFLRFIGVLPREIQYLDEDDILNHGFTETLRRNHFIYYKKGKMTLKWDFHIEHRIVTIKWGKALRFFGNVETKQQLDHVLNMINKYFGKND